MAAIAIVAKALPSRAIRLGATGGSAAKGVRSLKLWNNVVDKPATGLGGIKAGLARFLNGGGRFVGFVANVLGFVDTSMVGLWELFQDGFTELWYFDWNVTVEQQLATLRSQAQSILLQLSNTLGAAVGWVTVAAMGFGVSLVIPVIGGAVLANAIRNKVLTEAGMDLIQRLGVIANQLVRVTLQQSLTWGWIGIRNVIRGSMRAKARANAARQGGDAIAKLEDYYRQQDAKPWTLQGKFREQIERIPDWLQPYVEEVIEGFQEAFWEGGYIIASELDAAYQAQNQDPQAGLILKPDKNADEQFYLVGSQQQVQNQAHQLLQQHRLLGNRDVGYVVGDAELTGRIPPSAFTLKLFFCQNERPPWYRSQDARRIRTGIVVENVKGGISWRELKAAALKWRTGSVRVTAFLDNGRQMNILAATEDEGQEVLTRLVSALTNLQIMRFSTGRQKLIRQAVLAKGDPGDRGRVRPEMLLYPAFAYTLVRMRWVDGAQGAPNRPEGVTPDGTAYYTRKDRFDLYPDLEPNNYPTYLKGGGSRLPSRSNSSAN